MSLLQFGWLITALRRDGVDRVRKGRPWGLPLKDRLLLVVAYWRTHLTLRLPAPLFGVSKSAAELSGAKAAVGRTTVVADGGYRGAGLLIPHRRQPGQTDLPAGKMDVAGRWSCGISFTGQAQGAHVT